MITENEYLEAVKIVKEYHQQINSIIDEMPKLNIKTSKKVKCINTYAGGHDLYFLTLGKEYDVIQNPYKRASNRRDWNNERNFGVIDDNGKMRYFSYDNPSRVWEFLNAL
jgi:hypothetical protein